ncbi:Hypothetical protein CINCED_3A001988 [Cinara cedri]|uniref:Uncharacterized protein n=1 Tax=Cinara cedri TaxID=506608 RepID=A0A5E4N045_9HEMI|nr:Hypothetical protein CINCED_3A001988 [Cinara cedri]
MDTWLKTGRLLSVEKAGLTSTCKNHTSSVPLENSTSHCEATPLQKATIENGTSLTKEYTQINCSKVKKRRYDEEYLSFGFIPIRIDTFPDILYHFAANVSPLSIRYHHLAVVHFAEVLFTSVHFADNVSSSLFRCENFFFV